MHALRTAPSGLISGTPKAWLQIESFMITSLVVAFALGRQSYGDHDREIRSQIQATYDGYAKAVLAHDLDGTMAYLTPDIVWAYPNGKEQHGSEIRDGLKSWEDSIKPGTKLRFSIDRLKIDSDDQIEAYVTLHYKAPEATSERTTRWHDTWVQAHGRWQNSRGEQLASKKK